MVGFRKRISYAFRCFFSVLLDGQIPADVVEELGTSRTSQPAALDTHTPPAAAESAAQAESSDRAVQVLALLQRDGRLIDFLTEDVSPYPDAQLGAAVRSIHEGCRQVLERYLKLEPIVASEEDQPITVPAVFDPALIRVVGNVSGQSPLRGLLRHRGWRAVNVSLPSLPQGTGRSVVSPAEVEIQ